MASRDRTNAIWLTVFASLLWGTSFPGTKWGLGFVGNDVVFLWLRFVIATAVTLGFVLFLRKMSLSIFRNPMIWLVGGFNATGFILQYVGLTITTASKTSLLVDINVVAVAVISYFVFRERLGRMQVGGIVVGSFGIVLLTLNEDLVFDPEQLLGDVLVFLAGWSWAFFIIINKKLLDKHTGIELSSAAIATCMVWLTIPTAFLMLTGADFSVEPAGWAAIVYLGLACTSAATLLWALGLEGVSATASATIMLIEVLTALIISIGLLEETLSSAAAVGAALVLAAIFLVAGTGSGEKEAIKPA
ncbi:MAG TPA: DMT family transporter [Thermoplasmata archaeon]|jgi:drug/metabolite transporter (DMT)-like permease